MNSEITPYRVQQATPSNAGRLADIVQNAIAQNASNITMTKKEYQRMQVSQAWQTLAVGISGIVIGGTAVLFFFPPLPPQVVTQEKTVVVDKPVPVTTNCLAFCKE